MSGQERDNYTGFLQGDITAQEFMAAQQERIQREIGEAYKQHADLVNHPQHYTSLGATCSCGQPIECVQITEHMDFLLGNVIKYVWRADHKNGVQDLEKARWYLDRAINNRKENR